MAITFTFSQGTPNYLQYLASHDGAAGDSATIPNALGASPDLRTNLLSTLNAFEPGWSTASSTLRQILEAGVNGFGPFPAGTLTQAQARALLNSDDSGAFLVSPLIPRCIVRVMPRAGVLSWVAEITVDGSNNPQILVSTNATAVTGECYIRLELVHTEEL